MEGSVVPRCSTGVPLVFQGAPLVPPLFLGVPCSGVPGFIVCHLYSAQYEKIILTG